MPKEVTSSRQRFTAGQQLFETNGSGRGRCASRSRSSGRLVIDFLRLLKGQVKPVVWALSTLTLATVLALVPPAATKFLIDYVLIDSPLPEAAPQWLPRDRYWLLMLITGGVVIISLLKLAFHIWGRWSATRV
ncbi:MAG: ABC transporter ATP-binding protein, partial [Planctomycetaceae bacterium]